MKDGEGVKAFVLDALDHECASWHVTGKAAAALSSCIVLTADEAAKGYPPGVMWREDPERPGTFHLDVHRDGWDVEAVFSDDDGVDFHVDRHHSPERER